MSILNEFFYGNLTPYEHRQSKETKTMNAKVLNDEATLINNIPEPEKRERLKPFKPYKRKYRRSGTGGIYKLNDHLYERRYTPTNAQGKREPHIVYAQTYEECEQKLNAMIEEVKSRIKAERE